MYPEFKAWWLKELENFQEQREYIFSKPVLLEEALTHASFAHESGLPFCNERLEFLGDAALELIVSKQLFTEFPDLDEGTLTRIRANLVCRDSLADWATDIGISKLLRLGKGLQKKRDNGEDDILSSLFADATEAFFGAVFLDGGLMSLALVVEKYMDFQISRNRMDPLADPKSRLQMIAQRKGMGQPSYRLNAVEGLSHEPLFHVSVILEKKTYGTGSGPSRKAAEFIAAEQALNQLEHVDTK
ncbi:MAG: ribonuclease III [Synergistales bacterium]|nr:ribonuclease III [Synergistales bacterium]